VIPSDGVSGWFFSAGPPSTAMPDLEPAAIKNLLNDGARRSRMTVDAYRGLIQSTANSAGVSFATALQVITFFERMPPGERSAFFEQLALIEQAAERYGVSVGRFVRIIIGGDGEASSRH